MHQRGLFARVIALVFFLQFLNALGAEDLGTRLLRQPAISKDHLAFVYAGDIWISDRDGQHPTRLTTHPAAEVAPHFSPDGNWIAFSAAYDNNIDVYVIPVQGGQPRRLTWHPAADVVTGWSHDGKSVLFVSGREIANSRSGQLYEVPLAGGYERKVMQAVAVEGTWSDDGKRLAYRPYIQAYSGDSGWRQHRGGDTPPIWIINPTSGALEKLPHVNASDKNPMWVGDNVAFISDRADGAANLFLYDGHSHALRQLTHETQWDVSHASAYGRTIVFESGGLLRSLNLDNGAIQPIPIHLALQSEAARPQWKDVAKNITNAELSPTGKRVLITARGDVFSVPAKDGPIRNLTATSGVREQNACWSHDGQRVAYLSDEGGIQSLHIRDALGLQKPARHALTASRDSSNPNYFTLLGWSPDDHRVVFQDNHLHLYAIDLRTDTVTLIDTSKRREAFEVAFSPDGQWLAYTVANENYLTQVRLYSFASGHASDVADHFIQTDTPTFGGDNLLYFAASIDAGPSRSSLDMSTQERPLRKAIYAAVLAADGHSPLPPKSDEESPIKAAKTPGDTDAEPAVKPGRGQFRQHRDTPDNHAPDQAPAVTKPTRIDLEGLSQRLVPIPIAERDYERLIVAADGSLFYLAKKQPGSSQEPPNPNRNADADLYRYNFEDRSEKLLRGGVAEMSASADHKKLLISLGEAKLDIADANDKLDSKPVELNGLRMLVDPRQEWRQIFDEVWRMERAFFYDPNMHGLDWQAVRARYEPLLEYVQRREDLNEVLVEMIGEMQVGHNRTGGGDIHHERPAAVGLLGADFTTDTGVKGGIPPLQNPPLYRIKTIYRGDRWNPFLVSPLTAAGVNVAEGDYILAINGHPLNATINIFSLLENTVEKQVALTVSRDGTTETSRTVTVVPVGNEGALRQWDWVTRNQEYVERKSGGKVAYVYLPDTADGGYLFFNRMFFAQIDHDAVIVDDRRNSGGQAANYILDVLSRKYLSGWKDRDGLVFSTPAGAIYGPKAMLIDQDAGSGGDYLPYNFRALGLGKLIGTRTWGGLIGISANPPLIDGGFLTVPFFRMYTPANEWHVENEGVAPDLEVALDPAAVNSGNDNQLDAAIVDVLEQLKTSKSLPLKNAPPYPTQVGH